MQIFVRTPKAPEVSVFDNMPGIRGAEDLFKKGQAQESANEEGDPKEKPKS